MVKQDFTYYFIYYGFNEAILFTPFEFASIFYLLL